MKQFSNFVAINCHAEYFIRCEIECDFGACINTQSIRSMPCYLAIGQKRRFDFVRIRIASKFSSLQLTSNHTSNTGHEFKSKKTVPRIHTFCMCVCADCKLCRLTRRAMGMDDKVIVSASTISRRDFEFISH